MFLADCGAWRRDLGPYVFLSLQPKFPHVVFAMTGG